VATDPAGLISQLLSPQASNGLQAGMQQYQDRQTQDAANQQQLQFGAAKLQQAQAQQAQAQAYQSDVNAYFKDPKPENLASLVAKYPEQANALKSSYDIMDAPAKESRLTQYGQLYTAAKNGRADLAGQQLDNIISAEQSKGITDTDATDLRDAVKRGDPDALTRLQGFTQVHLAAASPEFAKVLGIGTKADADEFTNTPQGVIYNKRTGESKGGGPASSGVPATIGDVGTVWSRMVAKEGGTNPDGTFRTSPKGAFGPAQLMPGTLPEAAQLAGLDPKTVATDPNANLAAGHAYFQKQLSDFNNDPALAAAAYNAGPARVKAAQAKFGSDWLAHLPAETQGYVASATGAQAGPTADNGLLTKPTLQLMAQQYLAGDKTVFQNLGRGKQGSANIIALREEVANQAKSQGLKGGDLAATMAEYQGNVAAERTAGNRMAQVDLSANEFKRLAPIALKTSNILDRAGWLPLAKVQQAIRNGTNDPKYRAFNAANNALVNTYARAISPSGQPTVADKQHGFDLLNTAFDKPSYEAVVNQMQNEVDAALKAPHDVRASLRQAVAGSGGAAPAVPSDIAAILKKYGH
jgi:hypothetical protein